MSKTGKVVTRKFAGTNGLTVKDLADLLVAGIKAGSIATTDIVVIADGCDSIRPIVGVAKGHIAEEDPGKYRFESEARKGVVPQGLLLRAQ